MAEAEPQTTAYIPGSITFEQYEAHFKEGSRNDQAYALNVIVQELSMESGLYFRDAAAIHLRDGVQIGHLAGLLRSYKSLGRYSNVGEIGEADPLRPGEGVYHDRVSLTAITESYLLLGSDPDILAALTVTIQEKANKTTIRRGLFDDLLRETVQNHLQAQRKPTNPRG